MFGAPRLDVRKATFPPADVRDLQNEYFIVTNPKDCIHKPPALVRSGPRSIWCFHCKSLHCDHAHSVQAVV